MISVKYLSHILSSPLQVSEAIELVITSVRIDPYIHTYNVERMKKKEES